MRLVRQELEHLRAELFNRRQSVLLRFRGKEGLLEKPLGMHVGRQRGEEIDLYSACQAALARLKLLFAQDA